MKFDAIDQFNLELLQKALFNSSTNLYHLDINKLLELFKREPNKDYFDKYGEIENILPENEDKIDIGDYEISHFHNGDYWLRHKTGEGTQVNKKQFETLIDEFYKKIF